MSEMLWREDPGASVSRRAPKESPARPKESGGFRSGCATNDVVVRSVRGWVITQPRRNLLLSFFVIPSLIPAKHRA